MFDNHVTCFSKVLSQMVCIMWTLYLPELRWPLLTRVCEVHKRVPFIILWFWKMLMCTGYLPFARFTLIVTLHNITFPKCGLDCEDLGRIWSGTKRSSCKVMAQYITQNYKAFSIYMKWVWHWHFSAKLVLSTVYDCTLKPTLVYYLQSLWKAFAFIWMLSSHLHV